MTRLNWHHHKVEELFAMGYAALAMLTSEVGRPWLSNTFTTFAVLCFCRAVYYAFKHRRRRPSD
jgi:hypothetical protein